MNEIKNPTTRQVRKVKHSCIITSAHTTHAEQFGVSRLILQVVLFRDKF